MYLKFWVQLVYSFLTKDNLSWIERLTYPDHLRFWLDSDFSDCQRWMKMAPRDLSFSNIFFHYCHQSIRRLLHYWYLCRRHKWNRTISHQLGSVDNLWQVTLASVHCDRHINTYRLANWLNSCERLAYQFQTQIRNQFHRIWPFLPCQLKLEFSSCSYTKWGLRFVLL